MDNFPKKTYSQQVHEKVFNMTNHQRNATTMKYHLLSVRRTIVKKTTNKKCWLGRGEKGMLIPVQCWWGCKMVQPV